MRVVLAGAMMLAVLYGFVLAGLVVFQRRILFRPDNTPPDLARAGVPGTRAVSVPTADGLRLLAWYKPPAEAGGLAVLYLHGNAGHIGHRAHRLQALAPTGWGVLLLEYRGYGGNPGHPSETGLLIDAHAGLAALQDMGFPPHRILLWGESLGTHLAARLAAEQEVAAVLLESPYTSIVEIASRRYPYIPVRSLLWDHFDSLAVIGRARAPVLVMHGARDGIVPVDMGRAMHDAAPEPKALWIAPDAGHVDLIAAGAVRAAWDFVMEVKRHSPYRSE